MKSGSKTKNKTSVKGLEGYYIKVGEPGYSFLLKKGRYRWGTLGGTLHDFGTYTATQPDEFSCIVELSSAAIKAWQRRCKFIRRGKTYTVTELPNGDEGKYKRDDDTVFLSESPRGQLHAQSSSNAISPSPWKKIEQTAAVTFHLTGESAISAATIPSHPSSKTPTVVRVTHSNVYGRVDSDVFVRLGDPKNPLSVQDFDTVSDWKQLPLVEDLLWSDRREEWILRAKAKGDTSVWSGTYETELQFPKGNHQIELKIISRVPEVCSIVLSNWKIYVR